MLNARTVLDRERAREGAELEEAAIDAVVPHPEALLERRGALRRQARTPSPARP